ncbi:MAG TPA: ROK family protein [Spirochaetales bacterium]|nr:ROK family protein [Spirochaetales bacterium]
MPDSCLAIDIGGSKILVGTVDPAGKVLSSERLPLADPSQDSILRAAYSLCDPLVARGGLSCIGVSIPGLADPERGLWLEAVFSKVRDFPIARILRDRYRMPVFIENDANNCAIGERRFGCAQGRDDFIWLTVSNGCGSGIFLGGGLFAGARGNAGELGHIQVTEGDYPCPCGNSGCLEAVAAGPGIARRFRRESGIEEEKSAKQIAELAKAGDPAALAVYRETGTYIGRALAAAVNVLNVPLVVLGGGISMDYPLYAAELEGSLRAHIYRRANEGLEIKRTGLGYEASLIGAAANAMGRA